MGGHRRAAHDDLRIQQVWKFVTTQHSCSQDTGFSSDLDQKTSGISTSGTPTNRTALGTEQVRRFLKRTRQLDSRSFCTTTISSLGNSKKEQCRDPTSVQVESGAVSMICKVIEPVASMKYIICWKKPSSIDSRPNGIVWDFAYFFAFGALLGARMTNISV